MRYREMLALVKRDGREAGKSAAAWVFDGNTTNETYRWFLQGIEDGDPAILDSVREPNLSGEYAGDPTPATIAERVELDPGREDYHDKLDELCNAWEMAASEAFWNELERTARHYTTA